MACLPAVSIVEYFFYFKIVFDVGKELKDPPTSRALAWQFQIRQYLLNFDFIATARI